VDSNHGHCGYSLATRDEMVGRNPCWKVSLLPERNVRTRVVSPEEFEVLKRELPEYALVLSIGYYLGMRQAEVLKLREKQIHFYGDGTDEGYIELHPGETKSGEGRRPPFSSSIGRALREHLKKNTRRDPERFLFATKKGNPLANFRRSFKRACKRAGIEGLWHHDFRRTAVTNMRKAGVHDSVIKSISGHKTDAVFKRYNQIDMDDRRDAVKKLENYLSGGYEKEKREELKKVSKFDYFNITSSLPDGTLPRA
jgi:integrase